MWICVYELLLQFTHTLVHIREKYNIIKNSCHIFVATACMRVQHNDTVENIFIYRYYSHHDLFHSIYYSTLDIYVVQLHTHTHTNIDGKRLTCKLFYRMVPLWLDCIQLLYHNGMTKKYRFFSFSLNPQ